MKGYIYKIFLTIIVLLAFWACEKSDDSINPSMDFEVVDGESSPLKVGFYAGGGATRTTMLSNGLSAEWVADDEIALWAKNSSGDYTLSKQVFKTYGIDSKRGFFTSTLSSGMSDEGKYTYYCCYPVPVSVDDSMIATFNIPAEQDGKATSGADIMIATPVEHGALTGIPDPEDHSGLSMTMNRMMHQFRFYIPSDNTAIGNEKITKLVLTFPRDIVGKVALDLANPGTTYGLTEGSGSKKIVMNLTEPLTISGNYACMVMNPTDFEAGEAVQVKAYTETMIAQVDPIDLRGRDFQAGHSTPVKLKVNAITDYPYSISFKVAANNLGEKPNSITLTAPSGCVWEGYDSNEFTYAPGREIEVEETFTIRFENEAAYRKFSGQSISVVYDSENTLTSQTVKVGDLSSVNSTTVSLTVPYLFFEDFSGIPDFSDGHDNPKVGTASDTYKGISELSGNGLSGWYGTRIGGQAGTAVRICCRYEHVIAAGAYYKGRIYTPFLSNIKDGKDVNISVSFRYGGNRNERDPLFGSPPKKSPIMYLGINTQETVTNPDQSEGDIIDSVTGMIAGSGFSASVPTSLSPMVIKGGDDGTLSVGYSYAKFEGTKNVTIKNVDNGMRLGWIITTDNTSSNTNGNYWLYLDDIKVQIAK